MKKIFLLLIVVILFETTGFSQSKKSQIIATTDTLWRFLNNTNGNGTSTFGFITGSDTVFLQGDGTVINFISSELLHNGAPIGGGSSEWTRSTTDINQIWTKNRSDTINFGGQYHKDSTFSKYTFWNSAITQNYSDRLWRGVTIGQHAGDSNTLTGSYNNTLIGFQAGQYMTTANDNFALGSTSMQGTSGTPVTAWGNVAIGKSTLLRIISGSSNVAIGNQSGQYLTTGGYNTLVGEGTGGALSSGTRNTFLGWSCGIATSNNYSTAIGYYAGSVASAGLTAVGCESARRTYGTGTTAMGYKAMYANTGGYQNSVFGYEAAYAFNGADLNCAFGYAAAHALIDGQDNIYIGTRSGYNIKRGDDNVVVGSWAGYNGDTLIGNVYIGYKAGYNGDSEYNTFLGFQAGYDNKTGNGSIAIGKDVEVGQNTSDTLNIGNIIHGDLANGEVYINDLLVIIPRAAAPTSATEGMIYSNSTDNHLYFYDGTAWKQLD